MGILISFCCIFTLVTVLAMIIEPSRFINGILILFCIAFWCLALVGHFFKNPDSWTTFLIVTLIMMVPICYGLITLFLFINGIIVILREGFSFSHSLSLILSLIMFTLFKRYCKKSGNIRKKIYQHLWKLKIFQGNLRWNRKSWIL